MADITQEPFTGAILGGSVRMKAIRELAPGALFDDDGNGNIINWREDGTAGRADVAQPSEAAIQAKIDQYNADWVTYEYFRNRIPEYQRLNQDDMRSDDEINGTTTWIDAIKAIKAKWPKDNSGPIE